MRKGISPIVAVVLLIAISVIAAVGLYFWVGGIATQQPTPDIPKTITAYAVSCNTSGNMFSVIMIANTSPPGSAAITLTTTGEGLKDETTTGLTASNGAFVHNCSSASISSGAQAACRLGCNGTSHISCGASAASVNGTNFTQGSGTVSIFGSNVAGAQITC